MSTHTRTKIVIKFIQRMNVQTGSYKIPTYKIYYEYLQNSNRNTRLTKIEFFRIFSRYFDSKRNGNQRFYLLNDCFDLSEEALKKAKIYNEKRDKKIKQKTQMQISSTGEKS